MNNADGGNVKFKFTGDSKDLEKKTNGLSSKFNDLGLKLGKVVAAGTAVATAAVVKFVKDAASSFAEFEQLEGGLESMLNGDTQGIERVTKASQDAYKDLQMSQNEYLTSFEGSFAIVKNNISKTGDAIQTTNDAIQLSSDLFNTFGGSTEQYSTAINWALKGTYSYLDNLNLGIVGTKEGFAKAAQECGYLNKSVDELTADEKIDIIKQYAEKTGVWGRSAKEASQTISGSLNMTKAAWSNLINEFGKKDGDIEGAFDKFLESAEAFGNNLIPLLERILDNTIQHLPGIIEKLIEYLPGLIQTLVPTIIQATVDLLMAVVDAAPTLVQTLTQMLPTIIQSLLDGIIKITEAMSEQIDEIIPMVVDAIMVILPMLIEYLPLFIEVAVKLMAGITKGLIKSIPTIVSHIPQVVSAIINALNVLPGKVLSIGGNLIKGLWNGIQDKKDWVINKIKGLGDSVIKAIKNIFGVHSPSTEFAFVGRMNMVGLEKGMEDMQPEIQKTIDSLFDLSPTLTNSMDYSLSPTINVVNNVDVNTDPLGQVVSNIKTFSNGAKNDYNYGMGV